MTRWRKVVLQHLATNVVSRYVECSVEKEQGLNELYYDRFNLDLVFFKEGIKMLAVFNTNV